jgi:spermidine synthase
MPESTRRVCSPTLDASVRVLLAWLLLAVACAPLAAAGEKLLLEKKSPFVTVYVSEDADGLRILRFEKFGARQSVVKLGDPDHLELLYARAIPLTLAFVDNPSSALVIGLGGGTIPGFLRKHYPGMTIDAVDIDPVVVAVARSHFGFREDERMRAHAEDGRRFVEQAKARYDLIFLDGFGTDSVPAHLTTREFLSAVKSRLTARGVVVGNLWGRDVNRLYDSMVRTYRSVFANIQVIDIVGSGNKLLIASPAPAAMPHRELVRRAQELSQRLRLRNDVVELAERYVRPPGIDGETGKLLVDAEVGAATP